MSQALPYLRCELEASVVARASSPGQGIGRARWVIERAVDLDRVKVFCNKGERIELLPHARRIYGPFPVFIVPAGWSYPHLGVPRRRFEQRSLFHKKKMRGSGFTISH